MNYVALYCPPSPVFGDKYPLIYGVAQCASLEENQRIMDFAAAHGIQTVTGDIYTVDDLIRSYKMNYPRTVDQ